MGTKRILQDPDFGKIEIRTNRRARSMTMRAKPDGLHVTVPPFSKTADVLAAIAPYKDRLLDAYRKLQLPPLAPGFQINAECFKLSVEQGKLPHFTVRTTAEGQATVFCPPNADYTRADTQKLLRCAIIRALKRRAEIFLPPLLEEWARRFNLSYRKVRITGAKSRWGSCSSAKTISLSCYLMLLPAHLADYVILHELAHTKEMNHSPAFYALLDSFTEGQARKLREELKHFRCPF